MDKSGEGLSDTEWEVYEYSVEATSPTTRLSLDNLNEIADAQGSYIDAVSLEPEPLVCVPGENLAKNGELDLPSRISCKRLLTQASACVEV